MTLKLPAKQVPRVYGGRLRIGVAVDGVGAYGRGVLRGVLQYVAKHGGWMLMFDPIHAFDLKTQTHDLAGLIVQVNRPEQVAPLRNLDFPVINVGDALAVDDLPQVLSDHQAIGRTVAEYFISRQLRSLAYLGYCGAWYARERYVGFEEAAVKKGIRPAELWIAGGQAMAEIGRWIETLPRPIALMCCDDTAASRAMLVGLDAGLRIPYDLAIIGVDNDELICHRDIPLASVAVAAERIGHEAARRLDRMLAGDHEPTPPMIIPPKGLILRQSADILAVDDAIVARAVGLIHHHTKRSLSVKDVLDELKISRRTLENHFNAVLGYTPAEEIRRTRVARAKQLLISTDLPLATVAYDCGFVDASHFGREFRRLTGMTPGQYRQSSGVES
ncbi:MAG: substrate-binding domain-containing protein [Phycisphaeraceae bacterium]|nr:substrate-binding domain-containing protein [Phycisphaeraceae bacterium]